MLQIGGRWGDESAVKARRVATPFKIGCSVHPQSSQIFYNSLDIQSLKIPRLPRLGAGERWASAEVVRERTAIGRHNMRMFGRQNITRR